MGVLVILQILVRDTKVGCVANTPVLAKAPAIHKALTDISPKQMTKPCPQQGRGCGGTSRWCSAPGSHAAQSPTSLGASREGAVCLYQPRVEPLAIPPSQGTFLRAESCPSRVIWCRNTDFSSQFGGSVSCARLQSQTGAWQSGQCTPELPTLHPATTSNITSCCLRELQFSVLSSNPYIFPED